MTAKKPEPVWRSYSTEGQGTETTRKGDAVLIRCVRCKRSTRWDHGEPYHLKDCPDHRPLNGTTALREHLRGAMGDEKADWRTRPAR